MLIEGNTPDRFLTNVLKGLATCGFKHITPVSIRPKGDLYEWADFSVEEFMAYDVVLTWCDAGYVDFAEPLGDSLAAFMDRGGAAVITTFATNFNGTGLMGRFVSEDYGAFVLGGQKAWKKRCLGEILDPTHPVVSGVNSFRGGTASYCSDVVMPDEAELIATWDDGTPLIAYKRCGDGNKGCNVMLNFFPPNSEVDPRCWS